jgi:hypothetical protein
VIAVISGAAAVPEGAWVALGAIWALLAAAAEAAEKTMPHLARDKAEAYMLIDAIGRRVSFRFVSVSD